MCKYDHRNGNQMFLWTLLHVRHACLYPLRQGSCLHEYRTAVPHPILLKAMDNLRGTMELSGEPLLSPSRPRDYRYRAGKRFSLMHYTLFDHCSVQLQTRLPMSGCSASLGGLLLAGLFLLGICHQGLFSSSNMFKLISQSPWWRRLSSSKLTHSTLMYAFLMDVKQRCPFDTWPLRER